MLLSKTRTLKWQDQDLPFTPSIARLSALAVELNKLSGGAVNSLSLAQQMLNGTVDPVFLSVAIRHFLEWCGKTLTSEEAYEAAVSGHPEVILFRMTYVETVVPNVDFGKKPDGQSPEPRKQTGKKAPSKKSTSRKSSPAR